MVVNLTKLLDVPIRVVNISRIVQREETGWVGRLSFQTTGGESPYAFDLEEEPNE